MSSTGAGRGVVEAVVWTGGVETPYRRAGGGPAVLLLLWGDGADHGGDSLFTALATEFRVIAPLRLPRVDGSGGWESWLRGLIDGLGLDRPPLVVDAALAPEAERCAGVDPGRIRGVVAAGQESARILVELRAVLEDD